MVGVKPINTPNSSLRTPSLPPPRNRFKREARYEACWARASCLELHHSDCWRHYSVAAEALSDCSDCVENWAADAKRSASAPDVEPAAVLNML